MSEPQRQTPPPPPTPPPPSDDGPTAEDVAALRARLEELERQLGTTQGEREQLAQAKAEAEARAAAEAARAAKSDEARRELREKLERAELDLVDPFETGNVTQQGLLKIRNPERYQKLRDAHLVRQRRQREGLPADGSQDSDPSDPFSPGYWNITKQGVLRKADPKKYERLRAAYLARKAAGEQDGARRLL